MIAIVNKAICISIVLSILFAIIEGEFSHFKCPKKIGKFPIPGSFCESFYTCDNWKVLLEESCPPDYNFSPIIGLCVYKDLYPCLEKPNKKECPRLNGRFLKKGTDCKSYFDCCNGEPTERKCLKGQLFNVKSGKCDYQERVECDENSKNKVCPKPNGNFVKPGSKCRMYFKCSKGKAKEKECPKNQIFDVKSQECFWKDRVTCKEKETSSESSSNESNESSSESQESSESPPDSKITTPSTTSEIISKEFIPDSTTEELKSPSPVTDSTIENASTRKEVSYSTRHDITSDPTSNLFESTTLVSQSASPEITSHSRTQADISTPQITDKSTALQTTDESSSLFRDISTSTLELRESTSMKSSPQEISSSPKITNPTVHPTLNDLTSDISSVSINEDILNSDSTTESPLEPTNRETSENIFISTHSPTEDPEVSTIEEISNSYHTEPQSSHGTKETVLDEISTEGELTPSSLKTTLYSSTDAVSEITTEIVDFISSDPTIETTSFIATKTEIFLSSTSAYQSTIDPVLVGFVCPEKTGHYPHPTNKHKFIACVHGYAYIMNCPSNLIYNHEQRKCLYNI